ncbi:NAD(H) kinase 1 [Phytophthora nicotianae]|uniref:NAD(H) kinase 1 n=1 Tax=Phytophthora nicotianae TaxID=4792 RepID=A0A0W8DR87_PHYNI|nr:NAD(H) kinase 1 [Phytophthora nicotianae]
MHEYDEMREKIIKRSREILKARFVKATAREVDEVKRCKDMVEAISGELIQFDFRNGPLRRKFDSVKYNLRKLEETPAASTREDEE